MGPIETKLREAAALPRLRDATAGARDANGKWVSLMSRNAVCFCAEAAVSRIGGRGSRSETASHVLNDAACRLTGYSAQFVNDTGGPIDDVWSEAIEAAHELEKAGVL